MDNTENAFRVKPAADIHRKIRKIASNTPNPIAPQNAARNDAERITILQSQVDELGKAVTDLALYIAHRDGIDLGTDNS